MFWFLFMVGLHVHADLRPVVVFVHGGAWVSGQASDYSDLAQRLDKIGLCSKLVDYRLAPVAKHPAPIQDLEAALQNLKVEKGCDAKRIYLVGHSAGAHLIAFWASGHSRREVKGFIGLEGIYDIPALVHVWPAYEQQFIRAEFGAANAWPAASPSRVKFKDRSPWLVLHSTADELVDVKQSADFVAHLRALKIPARLVKVDKPDHFGVIKALGERDSAVSKSVLEFIQQPQRH